MIGIATEYKPARCRGNNKPAPQGLIMCRIHMAITFLHHSIRMHMTTNYQEIRFIHIPKIQEISNSTTR